MENYRDEIVNIVQKYYNLNQELREVEKALTSLQEKHSKIKHKKIVLGQKEEELINKIEEDLGRKVTLTELYQIICQTEV